MAILSQLAAPVGSTGNNTHQSVGLTGEADAVCVDLRVTAVGATPTVTYVVQGSLDDATVADASSKWVSLLVYPAASDTGTATPAAATAVNSFLHYFGKTRFVKKIRLVTSANTNVTYEASIHELVRT